MLQQIDCLSICSHNPCCACLDKTKLQFSLQHQAMNTFKHLDVNPPVNWLPQLKMHVQTIQVTV